MKLPLWRRGQNRELDEEIESHLRLAIADRVEHGDSVDEATRAVRRQFGNVGLVKEVTRDMWGWISIEQLAQDVRYAFRSLRTTPGFAAVAVATLGLGIGVNSAMFSVINAVMLRPLPFPASERLVDVAELDLRPGQGRRPSSVSWPDFFDWRSRTRAFAHLSAYHETAFTMIVGGRAVHTPGAVVSADLFSTLRVQPALGRPFRIEEERAGSDVAVISDTLWRSEFGGAATVVGRVATINSRPFTIIGIMPERFRFPISATAAQVWITVAEDARTEQPDDQPTTEQRGAHYIKVIGRLRPDATIAAAQAEMDGVAATLAREYPDDNGMRGVTLTPELERLVGDTRRPLLVLIAAVACVLLIACVNLANLLLARGAGRGREIALCLALGASRRRIVLQLLTESVVLAAAGTAAALVLAAWSIRVLTAIAPTDVRGLDEVAIDAAVLAFTAAMGFISALSFGTVPALLASRTAPGPGLKDSARTTAGRGQGRLRAALVVAETGIGVMLLVAAGLLVRGFYRLAHTDPGFDATHVMTAKFTLPESRYSYRKQIAFYDELLKELNGLPGVQATAAAPLPLNGSRYGVGFELPDAPLPPSKRPSADFGIAAPGYFRAMEIPIVEGRDFSAADDDAAPRVVVVNESFARQFLTGRTPIGQRIKPGLSTTEKEAPWREVIGVVRDFRQRALTEPSRPAYFVPYAQGLISTLYVVIRTTAAPSLIVDQLRHAVLKKDPELALYDVRTMDEYVDMSMASVRFQTRLLTLFATMALVLMAVGLYGVVAYSVAQRTREFGIRLALGARPCGVRRLILRNALRMVVIGVLVGVGGAAFATRLLGTALYDVHPLDPITFAAVVATLVAVALAASFIPAQRATRVDPIQALRAE
jgi:putative ABC transport system permease protein